MSVTAEKARVFRGGGRRWFTLNAACNAEARAKIMERCECHEFHPGDWPAFSEPCGLHDPERYPKILRRLSRMHKQAYLSEGSEKV